MNNDRPKRDFKGWLIPVVLLLALVYVQWPMLKGQLYETSDASVAESVAWRTDFTASWCPPCKVMKHEVWPDAKVKEAVEKGFIPVLVDIDLDRNKEVASRYAVRSIPHIMVADAEGKALRQTGYMTADQTLDFLRNLP